MVRNLRERQWRHNIRFTASGAMARDCLGLFAPGKLALRADRVASSPWGWMRRTRSWQATPALVPLPSVKKVAVAFNLYGLFCQAIMGGRGATSDITITACPELVEGPSWFLRL